MSVARIYRHSSMRKANKQIKEVHCRRCEGKDRGVPGLQLLARLLIARGAGRIDSDQETRHPCVHHAKSAEALSV
jgi:hypothetical protein